MPRRNVMSYWRPAHFTVAMVPVLLVIAAVIGAGHWLGWW